MNFKQLIFHHTKQSWEAFKKGNFNVLGKLEIVQINGFRKFYNCDYATFKDRLGKFNKIKNIT